MPDQRSDPMRLAVCVGSMRVPGALFVVDHALRERPALDAALFTYALDDPAHQVDLPVHVPLPRIPLPPTGRRRSYPVTEPLLRRRLVRWSPHVVNLHFMSLGGFAADAAGRLRVPLVTTVHANEPLLESRSRSARARYLRRQCAKVLDRSDRFLAVSRYIADWLRSLGVSDARVLTSYVGVDTDFWRPGADGAAQDTLPTVAFVGNLTTQKGVMTLIDLSRRLQDETPHVLEIVGDGPLRDEVARVSDLDERVVAHGRLTPEGVRDVLRRSRALVLPARRDGGVEEAAGLVLLEAQATAVPVIAFDSGGVSEMLAPVSPAVARDDADAMAQRILDVLTLPSVDFSRLADASRAWVVEHRDLATQAARSRRILEDLARARG